MLKKPTFLTQEEIKTWPIPAPPHATEDKTTQLHNALSKHGQNSPNQVAGVHWAMGCVALEITQRCNLDCTLCYLSEQSEAVHDLPLEEVKRRIDAIEAHYGPGTNVQVTGGDPTLRKRDDLIQIVAWIAEKKMRPALFTNGIKATRDLLIELKAAGLKDVAFHVDMTQQRKGYASEADLNAIREDYIARARGLGLHILFNTTVFDGNFKDVTMLAAFFAARAADVHLASFQMQAETGRGILGAREEVISLENTRSAIARGIGFDLSFDHPQVGHTECNRYAGILSAGGVQTPIFDDPDFFARMFALGMQQRFDRYNWAASFRSIIKMLFNSPGDVAAAARYALRKAWALKWGLLRSGGKLHKLTFYMHNFMDAKALDRARCESCVFMTMTRDGPLSMCVHNAKRDEMILQTLPQKGAAKRWDPMTGTLSADNDAAAPLMDMPLKKAKGRTRAAFMKQRHIARHR